MIGWASRAQSKWENAMSKKKTVTFPMQPIHAKAGIRFVENKIVRRLLDEGGIDLNKISGWDVPQADREQFAQLIGYSISGYHELPYVSDRSARLADKLAAAAGYRGGCRSKNCAFHSGVKHEPREA